MPRRHPWGDAQVVAYRLPTAHAEGMLAVYVPSARILLVKFVKARGIAVDRVAGGHGVVLPWANVERAAAP